MQQIKIEHKQQNGSGSFYVQGDNAVLACITYSGPEDETIWINHTEVDQTLRHENVGYKLVDTAVHYAREKGLKIVPVCPFVKAVFDKKPEYTDVLQEAS